MNFSRSRNAAAGPITHRSSRPPEASQQAPRSSNRVPPTYEAPEFSLNPNAQRALATLTRTHDIRRLETSLGHAQETLMTAAAEINERLREKTTGLNHVRTKAQQNTEEDDDEEQAEDNTLRVLEEAHARSHTEIENMTKRMDETFRKLVDAKQAVKFITEAVVQAAEDARSNAATQASTQTVRSHRLRQWRGPEDEGNGSEEEDAIAEFQPTDPAAGTPLARAPVAVFRAYLDNANIRYQSHTLTDRYARDSQYIDFRRTVHDAIHPNDEVPLPPQHEWFNEEDGTVAAPGHTRRRRDGEDYEEEDIAIARTTISTRCPLTLQEFKEPLTSTVCSHTFEKAAILEYLKRSALQCPVPGCDQLLKRDKLEVDKVLLRKIRRLQKANQMQDGSDEDEEDEDSGRRGTQRRTHVIDEDEDADSVDDLLDESEMPSPSTRLQTEPQSSSIQKRNIAQATSLHHNGASEGTNNDLSDEEMEDAS